MADALSTQIGYALLVSAYEVITFPVWWYSHGLAHVFRWAGRTLRGWEHTVGLALWARNLFVPMFGQTDWQGRIISFWMRLFVLVGRLVQVLGGGIAVVVLLLAYLVFPILTVWQIFRALAA